MLDARAEMKKQLQPYCGFLESTLTSFLHEGEEVIQKFLPFGVIVEFIQLEEKTEAYQGGSATTCQLTTA